MADADQDQQVTAWDEQGNPVKAPAQGVTAWDENGNPVDTAKQAEPAKKPAGQRFEESFRGAMGFSPEGGLKSDISDIGAGFKQLATHPWESAKLLGHGIVDPMQQTFESGMERFQKPGIGNKIAGGVETMESGVPMLGPWFAGAGHQFESGDIAGGLGTMAPAVVAPAMERGIKAAPGVLRTAGQRIGEGMERRQLAKSTREIKEAAPPARQEINYDAQLERAKPYLAEEQRNAPVTTVREAYEAANNAVKGIESKIGSYIDELPETDRVSGQEIRQRAIDRLNDPASPRSPEERAAGIRALDEFLTEEVPAAEEGGEPTREPKDLSVKEADRLRWRFNRDMDSEMGMTEADRADVRASNPKFAAKEAAAEALRDAVYDHLDEAGVPGIKEIRGDEGAVLQQRDAYRRNITRAEKSNAPSAFRRLGVFGPVGLGFLGETIGSRLGLPPGVAGAAGLGTAAAYEWARNRMRPNPLMERGFGRLGKSNLRPNFPTMPIQGQVVGEPTAAAAAPPVAREVPPNYPQLTEFAGREPGAPPPVTTGTRELVGEPEEKILAQRLGVRQPIRGALPAPAVPPEPVAPPNAAGIVEATGQPADERVLARGGGIRQPVRGLLPPEAGQTPPPKGEPPAVKVNRPATVSLPKSKTSKTQAEKPTAKLEKVEAGKTPAYVAAAAKEAGAMPAGYQPGDSPGMGFFQFHDPELGGSFYIREGQVSVKAIKDAMEARRTTIEPSPLVDEKTANVKKEMARRKTEEPAEEEGKSVQEEFSPEQLEDAELGVRQELETRQSSDRPGRYPIIESREGNLNQNWQEITGYRGLSRIKNLPITEGFSPTQVEVAMRRKAGRVYDTLIRRAVRPAEEVASAAAFNPEEERGILPGMGEHVRAQEEGAGRVRAQGLTQELGRPLGSIESAAGEMERKSPLFRGTAASPQGELLGTPLRAEPRVAAPSGAGESAESAARTVSERTTGVKYYLEGPGGPETRTPISSIDANSGMKLGKGKKIIRVGPEGESIFR